MATDELDQLLYRVTQGEANDDIKAEYLRLAIEQGNLSAIQTLLEHGADPYFIIPKSQLPVLYWAANSTSDNVESLKLLLEHQDQKTDESNLDNVAISPSTEKNHRSRKTDIQIMINKLLHEASYKRNPRCVRYLLEKGADVNYFNQSTPIINACMSRCTDEPKCLETIDILLNHGADLLVTGTGRQTALHWAALWSMTSVISRLLSAGCPVNMQSGNQDTPLFILLNNRRPNTDAIEFLLKFGAKMEYTESHSRKYSRSALVFAVNRYHNSAVEILLKKGSDPDFMDNSHYIHGNCAIEEAIWFNNVTAVKLLIQYNCDVNYDTIQVQGKIMSVFRLAAYHICSPVMCTMLALAGCDRLEMNECITYVDSHMMQMPDVHLWQEMQAMIASPFMLKELSRLSIRNQFRHLERRMKDVSQLPLPKSLQEYLMLKELDVYI